MADEPNPDDLLLFTPVPALRVTRAGWSPTVQREFIRALSLRANVSAAAHSVGRSARSAYQLRARAGAESFAAAWDWALEYGLDEARARVFDGAMKRRKVPIVRRGQVVGWERRHDDRLAIVAIRMMTADRAPMPVRLPHRERIADRDVVRQPRPPGWRWDAPDGQPPAAPELPEDSPVVTGAEWDELRASWRREKMQRVRVRML